MSNNVSIEKCAPYRSKRWASSGEEGERADDSKCQSDEMHVWDVEVWKCSLTVFYKVGYRYSYEYS